MIVSAGFAIALAVAMPAAGFAESVGSLTSTGSSTASVESIEQDAEALDSDTGGSSVSTTGGGQVSNEDMGNAPVQNSALPESAQEPQTVTEGVEQDSGEIDYLEESASATGDEAIGYQLTVQPKNEAERQEASRPDGFEEVGGEVYYYEGGERVTGEKRVGDSWYYFDPARGGAMAADEFVLLDDADVNLDARDAALRGKKWVYYGEDGAMCYGERNVGGSWYYLAPDSGAVSYGFVYIAKPGTGPAKWVYYGETMGDGKMRYGEQNVGGSWYYLAPGSGAVSYGFVLLPDGALDGGRKWVYYGPYMGDGKMRKGEQYIDGGWYYLIPATGEVDYEWSYIPDKGKWVYYGPEMGDGRMRYGLQNVGDGWCYFNRTTGAVSYGVAYVPEWRTWRYFDKGTGRWNQGMKVYDWSGPSGGAYPSLANRAHLNIHVDLANQITLVRDGSTVLYAMICSTGVNDCTPHGTYRVTARGYSFYNRSEGMGARYYVQFFGDYLFHSVPIDARGNYMPAEGEKLGRPASHGCVRLTISDAKWLFDNIPNGTPVTIS